MNRTRMDAEAVRDSRAAAERRLDETMYGPPVQHFISKPGVHVTPDADYGAFDVDAPVAGGGAFTGISSAPGPTRSFEALDCPDASQSAPARSTSVGALQALALWNNKFTSATRTLAALAVEEVGGRIGSNRLRRPPVVRRAPTDV